MPLGFIRSTKELAFSTQNLVHYIAKLKSHMERGSKESISRDLTSAYLGLSLLANPTAVTGLTSYHNIDTSIATHQRPRYGILVTKTWHFNLALFQVTLVT
jgi:hypothetical protein